MSVYTEKIGVLDSQTVERFTIENGNGLQARLISYGATLTALELPGPNGAPVNVTLGYDDLDEYVQRAGFFGCAVGRFANRIAGGRFELDGSSYMLPRNENGVGTLHGGDRGLDKYVWNGTPADDSSVRFECQSPDRDQGFPGTLNVAFTYSLTADNKLVMAYEARTDRPTPVNLTNHAYWNLAGAGTDSILDHEITLHAEKYLPVDDKAIPTGEQAAVAGTPMDFATPHRIGERIAEVPGGYDHCYVLNDRVAAEPALAAAVHEPQSGRRMNVWTDQPGIQFYTGNFLDSEPGADGKTYDKNGAFCLEAQQFPDCVNQPTFPQATLRPGDTYRHTTIHEFVV